MERGLDCPDLRIAGDGSRKEGCECLLCSVCAGVGVMRGAGLTASVSVSGLRCPVSVTRRQAAHQHGAVRGPGNRVQQKLSI